jgi:hypothetical protein
MSTPDPAPRPRRSRTPLWVIEGLDIARLRAVPLRVVAGAICAVGIALAILAPELVPPTPLVGAAVAVAGLLLGLAAAVAVDAADLTVRGPRHVRAAGGELVAILPTQPDVDEAMPLAEAVLEAREGENKRLLLGLAAAGRDARRCAAWTDALAVALARTGASVLRVDLASGRSERAGLVEVVREGRKLPSVVTFEPDLRLARIGAGRDHAGALEVLPTLPARLPRDLDVLLVALPTAASRQVVAATRALDHVLVVTERDTTSRVDLIAGLDALEAAGIAAQVALLDDRTARLLSPPPADEPVSREDAPGEDASHERAPGGSASDEDGSDGSAGAGSAASDVASDGSSGEDPAETRALQPSARVVPAAGVQNPADTRVLDQEAAAPAASQPSSAPDEAPARTPAGAEDVGIRLLPGAETTPRPAASDLAQPSVVADRAPATAEAPAPRDQLSAAARPTDAPEPTAAQDPQVAQDPPATPRPQASQQPSVSARDVDVMLEAAAAGAAARAETDDDPLPPVGQAAARQPAARQPAERRPDRPQSGERQPAEREAPQEPVPWVTSAELPDPVDVTDELPRIESHSSRPRRQEGDQPERDDLRTTAQLAILLDDLEARRDRP